MVRFRLKMVYILHDLLDCGSKEMIIVYKIHDFRTHTG